jgi:RNA polymerase sigma-70 factor, ECF subfamily
VGITPSQPVETASALPIPPALESIAGPVAIEPQLLDGLWRESDADALGLTLAEFTHALLQLGAAQNFGQPSASPATSQQQAAFFHSLKLADLALAKACAKGSETAWERFLAVYHHPLTRAAIAICGNETTGHDLADALYAELYGLRATGGERRCPLDSYKGRGSLLGWLRATLAQRHVDHHRRTFREQPIEDAALENVPDRGIDRQPATGELDLLSHAITGALAHQPPEDRFLLASYFLDGRTLLQIAQSLHVHEATVSRRVHRLTANVRKQLLKNLESSGLSRRAALEQLGTDPRDLDLNLKKLLQYSQSSSFQEEDGQ